MTGLYTNIPHKEGIDAIKYFLHNKRRDINPPNHRLLEMLELVLKCNNFTFNGDHYLQINGTAMGTKVAPTYANLFMDHLESKHIYTHPLCPQIWKRFIDDIWGIFRGMETQLIEFHKYANSIHPTIKFTMEYFKDENTFLDMIMYVEDGILKTQLYCKPKDSHSYLDFDSCHLTHNKTSIPYSQFLRIRRNCTDWAMFMKYSIYLYSYLSMRGYSHELITPALLRANQISQTQALQENTPSTEKDSLYCIIDYNPTNPPIKEWIKQLWPILEHSSGTRILTDFNIIYGYRKP